MGIELIRQMECIARRTGEGRRLEIEQDVELAPGIARRGRDDHHAQALCTIMQAQATGEQAIAIGNMQRVLFSQAGHGQRTRHAFRPEIDVFPGIAHNLLLAGGA